MKKITIMSFVALLCSFICDTAFAEVNPPQNEFTNITVITRNGRVNDNGTVTYAETKKIIDSKKQSIKIYCLDPGDNKCPAEITVLVTIVTGLVAYHPMIGAMNMIKDKIANGQPKGKLVYDDMLYTWDNGVLLENGTFEMSLQGVEYNKVLP